MPSHYLNQYWVVVYWTLKNKLQWKFNQNTKLFIHKKYVCKSHLRNGGHLVQYSIYASVNWVHIGSGNRLLPVLCQAITWTNADFLSTGPSGTNFREIQIKIQNFSLMKLHFKWLYCNVFSHWLRLCSPCSNKGAGKQCSTEPFVTLAQYIRLSRCQTSQLVSHLFRHLSRQSVHICLGGLSSWTSSLKT